MNKKLLGGMLALGLVGTFAGTTSAFAAEQPRDFSRGPRELIEALAEHFNLDEAELQAFFEEQRESQREEHAAHRAQMDAERLANLVEDGTLTQEQADALANKHADMKELADSLQFATPEEREAAFKEARAELHAWMEEQGIPDLALKRKHDMGPMKGGVMHNFRTRE